jgi:hypothetical protein
MQFLAGEALRGRGSATHDEHVAAAYAAGELEKYGVAPAGDHGGYLQRFTLVRSTLTSPPTMTFTSGDDEVTWKHGDEVLFTRPGDGPISGPLQKVVPGQDEQVREGSIVVVQADVPAQRARQTVRRYVEQGAAAVLLRELPEYREQWEALAGRLPQPPIEVKAVKRARPRWVALLSSKAAQQLAAAQEGSLVRIDAEFTEPQKTDSWNVIGKLAGSDSKLTSDAVLLSAHLDHLGVSPKGDKVFPGADDDASGVTAVLELARVLAGGPRPKRTVIFALFGSEENGLLGSTYFLEHPPVPLNQIVANLEFEMIGRPDPAVAPGTLWLTGWERSNLGPALAERGARLVGDPHPEQNFFRRSDNFALAKRGVVAQTVCSYGLHQDYHRPTDDLSRINFPHMRQAIQSMIKPIEWLVNSDFRPQWKPGGQPTE